MSAWPPRRDRVPPAPPAVARRRLQQRDVGVEVAAASVEHDQTRYAHARGGVEWLRWPGRGRPAGATDRRGGGEGGARRQLGARWPQRAGPDHDVRGVGQQRPADAPLRPRPLRRRSPSSWPSPTAVSIRPGRPDGQPCHRSTAHPPDGARLALGFCFVEPPRQPVEAAGVFGHDPRGERLARPRGAWIRTGPTSVRTVFAP